MFHFWLLIDVPFFIRQMSPIRVRLKRISVPPAYPFVYRNTPFEC